MKAPVGLLSGRAVLRKQDGGVSPRQAPARSQQLCVQNLIRKKTISRKSHMKYDERICKFNMDTGCVELLTHWAMRI
jgi:hypothetical protein